MEIGELRRKYFADFNCGWNGLVRDISAEIETDGQQVDEAEFLKRLIYIAATLIK